MKIGSCLNKLENIGSGILSQIMGKTKRQMLLYRRANDL